MQKNTLKLALLLVLCLALVFVLAGCPQEDPDPNPNPDPTPTPSTDPDLPNQSGFYTYGDTVSLMATNWNPHTYQSENDSYPISYIQYGFYDVLFADDTYTTYKIVPAMAAAYPVDVTSEYVGEKWGIDEDDEYRAWKIALNPDAKFENGTVINADTYLYSMKMLLDPQRNNYRASDWMDTASFALQGGYEYYWSDKSEDKCLYYLENKAELSYETTDMWLDIDNFNCVFFGRPAGDYYKAGYTAYFDVTINGETYNVYEKYAGKVVKVTAEMIEELNAVSAKFGDTKPLAWQEWVYVTITHEHVSFDNVGILKTGEYELTFILNKSIGGATGSTYEECEDAFYLLYALGGNFLVYPEYYEKYTQYNDDGSYKTTTYNTSLETTMSYGPYKLSKFTRDAYMQYDRNENWFGYNTEKYPQYKGLYQTDRVTVNTVKDSETNKLMFLKGQIMGYGLQATDMEDYRLSRYAYHTPADTIFFLVLSGHKDILNRQTETVNKSMILNENFRKGMAVVYDKAALCSTISPARTGAYGIIGNTYVINPATGETYRESDAAKEVLCEYYGVKYGEGETYETLDEAVDSITGFDANLAKQYLVKAFEEEIAAGNLTDKQTVIIDYSGDSSAFIDKTLNYMTEQVNKILAGTGYENRIKFTVTANAGDQWSDFIKDGSRDACLCGWTGSRMDPFGLPELYIDTNRAYDAAWADNTNTKLTITVEGEDITLTMDQWQKALQGNVQKVDGVEYNFGHGKASVETRTYILSRLELAILETGSYIPMMQNAGLSLRSAKAHFANSEYNALLGWGGITYLTYDYDDAQWYAFVKSMNNDLASLYKAA